MVVVKVEVEGRAASYQRCGGGQMIALGGTWDTRGWAHASTCLSFAQPGGVRGVFRGGS